METTGTRRDAIRSERVQGTAAAQPPTASGTTAPGSAPPEAAGAPGETPRAQPPIRWPHPKKASLGIAAVWAVGLVVALVIPAMIVGPGQQDASTSAVWTAFSVTFVGAAIMLAASAVLFRRTKDVGALVMGGVPAVAVVAGGVIIAASKLTLF